MNVSSLAMRSLKWMIALISLVAVMQPVMRFLWLYPSSGNANFYYNQVSGYIYWCSASQPVPLLPFLSVVRNKSVEIGGKWREKERGGKKERRKERRPRWQPHSFASLHRSDLMFTSFSRSLTSRSSIAQWECGWDLISFCSRVASSCTTTFIRIDNFGVLVLLDWSVINLTYYNVVSRQLTNSGSICCSIRWL